jgi:mRNA-degrading endonuclease RelE of RelBE toxin-antitoxin system
MTFEELPEFQKDLKRLLKKYRSLIDDLEVLKLVIAVSPMGKPPISYCIDNSGLNTPIIKIKKIACKSLKGKGANSGLRITYAYQRELDKITFIELYFKADQENENRERIKNNFD